jgi:hypothetical protein
MDDDLHDVQRNRLTTEELAALVIRRFEDPSWVAPTEDIEQQVRRGVDRITEALGAGIEGRRRVDRWIERLQAKIEASDSSRTTSVEEETTSEVHPPPE